MNRLLDEFALSEHAERRLQQRAIHLSDVEVALLYGEKQWSHGDRVFVLTDRALHHTPYEKMSDRLRGLCVVLTRDNVVRTVKWHFRCAHHPGVLRRAYLQQV